MSADGVEDLGIRLRADGVLEATNGIKLFGASLDDAAGQADNVTGKHKRLNDGLVVTDQTLRLSGKSAKELAQAYRLLPAQITDIVTSLASGQPAWLVAIQQGGQLRDSFGGLIPMFHALGAIVTPTGLILGSVGTVIGATSVAMYQGWQDSRRFADGLAMVGNRAGITEGQLNQMVLTTAAAQRAAAGDVRELLQQLTTSGITSGAALDATKRAAIDLARVNGETAAEAARSFAGMADGVSDWAARANRSYRYLTAEQFKQIMALEAQGRTSEAVRVNMEALGDTLERRTIRPLGAIERLLNSTARGWSNFKEQVKGIGRTQTVEELLAELQQRYEVAKSLGRDTTKLQAAMEPLQREAARNSMRAADQSAEERAREEATYKASRQYQDTLLAAEAGANQRLEAQQLLSLERRRIAAERGYERLELSAQDYRDRSWAIERERLAIEEDMARREVSIESRRVVKSEADVNARNAAVAAAEARLLRVKTERARLEADLVSGRYDPKAREVKESPQAAFRRDELAGAGAVLDDLKARRLAAIEETRQLGEANKALNVDLIKDDRARGEAQIALEAEQLKRRMDMGALSGEERKRAEDAFAAYVLLRQQQLNEQLKPEWQRMLELWGDTTRAMRARFDEFQNGWLQAGQQAWAEYFRTGRLSLSGLRDFAMTQFGQMLFQRFGAPMFAKLGEGLAGLMGISNPAQGAAAAAETSARTANTTAMTISTSAIGSLTTAAQQAATALQALGSSGGGGAGGLGGNLLSLLGLGGGGGAGGFSTGLEGMSPETLAFFFHGGGAGADRPAATRAMPASLWARAPRFHTGVGPDEMPAVIQRSEGVFTKGQMRAMAPVADLAKAGGGTRITFAPQISVDSRTDRAEVMALVGNAMRQSQAQLLDLMERRQV